MADRNSADLSVILSQASGSGFAAPQRLPVQERPVNFAVADVNRDGRMDLVAVNANPGTVSVLIASGAGQFLPQAVYKVGDKPNSLVVADMDGDGQSDVIVTNESSNTVSVLRGQDGGTFAGQQSFAVGVAPRNVRTADLSGDGLLELVVANSSTNDVSVLTGLGQARFAAQRRFVVGGGPFDVQIIDANHDQKADLLVTNQSSNQISVVFGLGDGSFAAQAKTSVGDDPRDIQLSDLNLDGRPDAVVLDRNAGTVTILLGRGDGLLAPGDSFIVGKSPQQVRMADVNGDGRPDILTTNYNSNTVSVLLGLGDGGFAAQTVIDVGEHPNSFELADLDHDGRLDLVTVNVTTDTVSVLFGQGDGHFAARTGSAPRDLFVGNHPVAVRIVDLDADGHLDLVTANTVAGTIAILLGNGNGTFEAVRSFPVRGLQTFQVGDLDGDDRLDVVALGDRLIPIYNRDGQFSAAMNLPSLSGVFKTVQLADLNRDGRPDLLLGGNGKQVSVLMNQGGGAFAAGQSLLVSPSGNVSSFQLVDVDGDDDPDLLAMSVDANSLSVLVNRGDGSFDAPVTYLLTGGPLAVRTADMNGDGRLDPLCSEVPRTQPILGQTGIEVRRCHPAGPQLTGRFRQCGHVPARIARQAGLEANNDVKSLGPAGADGAAGAARRKTGGQAFVLATGGTGPRDVAAGSRWSGLRDDLCR